MKVLLNILASGAQRVVTYLVNAMGTALSWTLNIGLGLIFAIYMLLDKERLMMQGKRILKAYASDEWVNRVSYVTRVAVQTFSNFFVGQFIDALIFRYYGWVFHCGHLISNMLLRLPVLLVLLH